MGLGRSAAPLLWFGGLLAASAVAAGNLALLGVALVPLGLVALSAAAPTARVTRATLELDPPRAVVGQEMQVTVRVGVAGGGPLHLRVALPDSFRLVEGSNTLHTWAQGKRQATLAFKVACDRRGVHHVGPVRAQAPSPWLLGGARELEAGEPVELRVDPVAARLRRWPESRARARSPMADLDRSPSGVLTGEFQDIRAYVRGDPHRSINWKASARRGEESGDLKLLVNDYEREGRRQVWVFLDARPELVGTNLDNGLERRIEVALALCSSYRRRGFAIGLTLYNQAPEGTPYPDSSGRQARRILEMVTALPNPPVQEPRGLAEAVASTRGHLHRGGTVAYVITTLRGDEEAGLRTLRGLLARRRGAPPIAVVHVDPAGLLPDGARNDLARTVAALDRPHLEAVRRIGIRAVRWDPASQGLSSLVRRLTA
ncbi:MAG: hypothetical protein QOI63_1690 [Thermoplasmata archaeon]|jgi:uncharacterized protein (DUF58 family)|nr:hypothetical protein [Thermoplasmata archaeon]